MYRWQYTRPIENTREESARSFFRSVFNRDRSCPPFVYLTMCHTRQDDTNIISEVTREIQKPRFAKRQRAHEARNRMREFLERRGILSPPTAPPLSSRALPLKTKPTSSPSATSSSSSYCRFPHSQSRILGIYASNRTTSETTTPIWRGRETFRSCLECVKEGGKVRVGEKGVHLRFVERE